MNKIIKDILKYLSIYAYTLLFGFIFILFWCVSYIVDIDTTPYNTVLVCMVLVCIGAIVDVSRQHLHITSDLQNKVAELEERLETVENKRLE